ncbi:MAG: hypothetical protein U1E29_03770 [Coriobacteriia bacterium]|nr:hypothetical protein [Coriobacteriia bacterium]
MMRDKHTRDHESTETGKPQRQGIDTSGTPSDSRVIDEDLGQIPAVRRSGTERFHHSGNDLEFDLLGFWQWSASDIVSNATRGRLAEYLIANAIGAAEGVRDEWAAYDLCDPRGVTIEVKSAAYIQSWSQRRLSTITFSCPKTLAWDPKTNLQDTVKRRQAEVYVFALQTCTDQSQLDPFDLAQWEFYVVPTVVLDQRERSQHSISLKSLQRLPCEAVSYGRLPDAIAAAAVRHRQEPTIGRETSGRQERRV